MTIEEKIVNNIELTEKELKECAFGNVGKYVDKIEGDNHRWHCEIQTIFKIGEQYYAIDWLGGLTECQANEFWEQPYKVKKEKVVITRTVYIPVEE